MSRLTRCNYCTLKGIHRAFPNGQVTTKLDPDGWTIVYVNGVWAASMVKIPDHCVCDDEVSWV